MKWFLDNTNTVRSSRDGDLAYLPLRVIGNYTTPPLMILMGIEITYGSDDESDREFALEVSVY